MVVDNEGRLLRVRLMLRAFNCGEIDAERQWCCVHRVQTESEYFAVKIARWSWNDAACRNSVAIEIPSDFCDEVARRILEYFQFSTKYWESSLPTSGDLDAADYLGMVRLLTEVVNPSRKECWYASLRSRLSLGPGGLTQLPIVCISGFPFVSLSLGI